jgi:hypothetical protein
MGYDIAIFGHEIGDFQLDIFGRKYFFLLAKCFLQFTRKDGIKSLEFVFEKQLHQLASALHSFVAVVVTIIDECWISNSRDESIYHDCEVKCSWEEIELFAVNMRKKNHLKKVKFQNLHSSFYLALSA